MYDYLIVGCGLWGATFARQMLDAGKTVLMVDKRGHIAGNCYTEKWGPKGDIHVHKYGPHQFHTRSKKIWDYVNRFAEFNHYRAHIKARFGEKLYSMPPNMMLYHQLWGVTTPAEAREVIDCQRVPCDSPQNVRDYILDALGWKIYEMFYEGYSTKQWGRDPSEIPKSVGRRLPISFTWTDRWFTDEHEGIPKLGYTHMIENMIDGADVELNVDFMDNHRDLCRRAHRTVYTGKIDEFFNYRFGELEYRSLRFEEEVHDGDFQGNSIINYTSKDVPWTRIVEHKHFTFAQSDKTIITREFPQACSRNDVPYYPVENDETRALLKRYQDLAKEERVVIGGRLGSFRYFDMDQTIGEALATADREIKGQFLPSS
jgi:UDP-galactopyranose mutase